MAIEAGDFKTGLTLIVDGDPWVVLDFMHVKPGKGAAILQTKMKNLKTGSTQERNFNASTKFEAANTERITATFSYSADGTYYFMDVETYETYEVAEKQIEDKKDYITDGYQKTEKILRDNISYLHIVAQFLFEHEKMSGEQFTAAMEGREIPMPSDDDDNNDQETEASED